MPDSPNEQEAAFPGFDFSKWEDAVPLEPEYERVLPFHDSMAPPFFANYLKNISDVKRAPIEGAYVAALVGFSTMVAGRIDLKVIPGDKWFVAPNLWGVYVARPGQVKSPITNEVLGPMIEFYEERYALENETRARQYQQDLTAIDESNKAVRKAIAAVFAKETGPKQQTASKSDDKKSASETEVDNLKAGLQLEPNRPPVLKFDMNDASHAAWGKIVSENQNAVLFLRDEAIGGLNFMDEARPFFLESWSGTQRYKVSRIERGDSEAARNIISFFGNANPGPMSKYIREALEGGENDNGFIQRIQAFVYMTTYDRPARNPEVKINAEYEACYGEVIKQLAEMDMTKFDPDSSITGEEALSNKVGEPHLTFDEDALEQYYVWEEWLEGEVASQKIEAIASHLDKYHSFLPSIALIYHLLETASALAKGEETDYGPIPLHCVVMAASVVQMFHSHAIRIYHAHHATVNPSASALLELLKEKKIDLNSKGQTTANEIRKLKIKGLRHSSEVRTAAHILASHNHLVGHLSTDGPGRPRLILTVNPIYRESKEAESSDAK